MEEGDGLHLARGTAREWLAGGQPVGVADAPTHFGPVSFQMQYDAARARVTGEVTFAKDATAAWAALHVRLPAGLRVRSVDKQSGAGVMPDGAGLRWESPKGKLKFTAAVGD
jgi:hypothetical protein